MSSRQVMFLKDLLQQPGNSECADCKRPDPKWTSYNIGIFICEECASIHRSLGTHISKVKSVQLDDWQDDKLQLMEAMGNLKARAKYEQQVPQCYKIPTYNDAFILREQWIRAKYERQEFTDPCKQTYLNGPQEVRLWKKGKSDKKFNSRLFVLSEKEYSIKYYNKEDTKDPKPKAVIRLDDLNAVFVPDKMGNPNGLQITYLNQEGCTRNLFLYSEDSKDIVDWYLAIRSCKLNRSIIAFPEKDITELASNLTHDFMCDGWLSKTGPKLTDGYRRRWFTLDNRKLMYYEDPLDAYPKGEIFIGNKDDKYAVRDGVPPAAKDQGFSFTLKTPDRKYLLSAETEDDKLLWMARLKFIVEQPVSAQDVGAKYRIQYR